jgi:hypothetical protein
LRRLSEKLFCQRVETSPNLWAPSGAMSDL